MASADVEMPTEPAPAPAVPDYLASPNAVFGDEGVKWRYGRAPDYSKTRKVWEEGKQSIPMTLLTHMRCDVSCARHMAVQHTTRSTLPCGRQSMHERATSKGCLCYGKSRKLTPS